MSLGKGLFVRGQTWRLAAQSALADGRESEFQDYLRLARNRIEGADGTNADIAQEATNIVYLESSHLWSKGQHQQAALFAYEAFQSGLLDHAPATKIKGILSLYVGLGAYLQPTRKNADPIRENHGP